MYITQVKDFDGRAYPPREHASKDAAIAHAIERSTMKQCEVTVSGGSDGFTATYRQGAEVIEEALVA